jgi:short-subunit dehydrogenase
MAKPLALITGTSSGIGAELAREHAAAGGDLIIVARRKDRLEAIADELLTEHGTQSTVIAKDLSICGSAEELYEDITARGLAVDYLINNAGFGGHGFFHERSLADDNEMIHVNIVTLMTLTKLFVPGMIARGSGRILNVGSVAGFVPGPLQAVYYATKAFVNSFTEALANELGGTGVTATALCPGITASGFAERGNLDGAMAFKMPQATSASVAAYGYKAMLDGERIAVHGVMNKMTVAGLRVFPRGLVLSTSRAMMEK